MTHAHQCTCEATATFGAEVVCRAWDSRLVVAIMDRDRDACPTLGGCRVAREWEYWTRNKLAILADYLPAFNTASAKSSHRVYLDLMAGEPVNIAKGTSETFDGSARVAMSAKPGFTRLAFCERDA